MCIMNQVFSSCDLLLIPFCRCCFSNHSFETICRFTTLIKSSISHHSIDYTQQSPSHRDISLNFSDAFNQPLLDRVLANIRPAKRHSRLTERPSESRRAGLGNSSRLSPTCRLLVVRSQSCPEFNGIGIRESVKWTYLSCDNTCPDFIDPRYALRELMTSSLGSTALSVTVVLWRSTPMKHKNLMLVTPRLSVKLSDCLVLLLYSSMTNSLKRANIKSGSRQNILEPGDPYTLLIQLNNPLSANSAKKPVS